MWSLDKDLFGSKFNSTNSFSIDFITNQPNKNNAKNFTKQHTITPLVQKLCKILDEDLSNLLNDIEYTANLSLSSNSVHFNQIADIITEDLKCFNEYLQANLKAFNENMHKSLISLIDDLNEKNDLNIKKILFVCRFINALTNNCPNLKICFNNINHQTVMQRQLTNKQISSNDLLNNLIKKKSISDQKAIANNDQNWNKFVNDLREALKYGYK